MKTIIERGASWSMEETKLLLSLWGQDLVQRQATNTKRTKEVYEKIAEKFNQNGHARTADQVRTRVFNMIAEYRRILKDQNPERAKKCVFFEPLHKIYQAKHMDDIKSALDDYEPDNPYSPGSGDDSVSDNEATDGNETTINNMTNDITKILASPNQTQHQTSLTTSSTNQLYINNNTNNSISLDNNNGDISVNNNTEKDSSSSHSSNSQSNSGEGATTKKIRLESPKSGQNQSNVPSTSSINTNSSTSTDHQNTSKQNKSTTSATQFSATIGAGATTSGAASSQRHQSLLLPHATTSSGASTPISKLTTAGSNSTPSYININSTKLPIIRTNQLIGHSNGNESINLNGTTTRLPTTAAITSHQLYQAPVNTFDVTSSALLIDRMFAHLSRESENMREWIALEKERLALERTRRQQETEREVRRERILIDTLMRFQEQWLMFLSRLDSRIIESSTEPPPELMIPKEASQSSSSAETSQTPTTQTSQANQNSLSVSTVTNSNQSAEASSKP